MTSSFFRRITLSLLLVLLFLAYHRGTRADENSTAVVTAGVKINPLEAGLTVPRRVVSAGQRFSIGASVRNRGDKPLGNVEIVLHVAGESCIEFLGPSGHHRTQLGPRARITETWHARAVAGDPGCAAVVVTASASAEDIDGEVLAVESGAKILRISQSTKPGPAVNLRNPDVIQPRTIEEPEETSE